MKPVYFQTAAEFRAWLLQNHTAENELWVGYYKKHTGLPSMSWPESVDEALCFGWIDGLRRKVDEERYAIRFTPRRPKSIWSAVNIKRVKELSSLGLMEKAGLASFKSRDEERAKLYSYERKNAQLSPEYEAQVKDNPLAWAYFEVLAPSYKKASIHWVMQAKKEETRQRRLGILIESCEEGKKIPMLRSGKG